VKNIPTKYQDYMSVQKSSNYDAFAAKMQCDLITYYHFFDNVFKLHVIKCCTSVVFTVTKPLAVL